MTGSDPRRQLRYTSLMNSFSVRALVRSPLFTLICGHIVLLGLFPFTALVAMSQTTSNQSALPGGRLLSFIALYFYVRCVIAWPLSQRQLGTWPAQPTRFLGAFLQVAIPVALFAYYWGQFRSPWQILDLSWMLIASIVLSLCTYQLLQSASLFAASLTLLLTVQWFLFGDVLGPFPVAWTYLPVDRLYYLFKPLVSGLVVWAAIGSLPSRGWLARRYGLRAASLWTAAVGFGLVFLPGASLVPASFALVFVAMAYFIHRRTVFADAVLKFLAPAATGASVSMIAIVLFVGENTARCQGEMFFLTLGCALGFAVTGHNEPDSQKSQLEQTLSTQMESV